MTTKTKQQKKQKNSAHHITVTADAAAARAALTRNLDRDFVPTQRLAMGLDTFSSVGLVMAPAAIWRPLRLAWCVCWFF